MTQRAILLAGIAALLAAPAGASVSEFRLPPAPTPTPTPTTVGPVDPDAPLRPAPRPAPAPSQTAVPTPSPSLTVPVFPSPAPTSAAPRRTASATPSPTASPSATTPAATAEATAAPPPVQPFPTATASSAPAMATEEQGGSMWPWLAGLLLLGGGALALWLRRRIGPLGPVVAPEIERPRVPPEPAAMPPPEAAPEPAEPTPLPAEAAHPLHIAIEPRKLSVTMMNAALGYRLSLTNAGEEPLEDIAVSADLIGAHASLPREEQLANPQTELAERHRLVSIAPGETGEVAGELRLPLNLVRPIQQGSAALFVPLARFRISAGGTEPRCFTLVVGQPSPRADAILPVRLDLGPRIYDGLAGRAF